MNVCKDIVITIPPLKKVEINCNTKKMHTCTIHICDNFVYAY